MSDHIQIRWKLVGLVLAAFAVPITFVTLKRLVDSLYWQPPPLLAKVTAGGGRWGACPSVEPTLGLSMREAISPELNQRLSEKFPLGSSEIALVRELQKQRFNMRGACKDDPSIRFAEFTENNFRAAVYWKVEGADTIVWTKGFVFYIFL
jgi:hypothetical protein